MKIKDWFIFHIPKGDVSVTFTCDTSGLKQGDQVVSTDRSILVIKKINSSIEATARYAQWYDFIWWLVMKAWRKIIWLIKKGVSIK